MKKTLSSVIVVMLLVTSAYAAKLVNPMVPYAYMGMHFRDFAKVMAENNFHVKDDAPNLPNVVFLEAENMRGNKVEAMCFFQEEQLQGLGITMTENDGDFGDIVAYMMQTAYKNFGRDSKKSVNGDVLTEQWFIGDYVVSLFTNPAEESPRCANLYVFKNLGKE